MAYEKQTWKTGDIITAEKLNHIENGLSVFEINIMSIELVEDQSSPYKFVATIDKTYNEIREAVLAEKYVVLNYSPSGGPTGGMVITCPLIGYSKTRINDEITPSGSMTDDTIFCFGCVSSGSQNFYIDVSNNGLAYFEK